MQTEVEKANEKAVRNAYGRGDCVTADPRSRR
jgi:hypothetical protein